MPRHPVLIHKEYDMRRAAEHHSRPRRIKPTAEAVPAVGDALVLASGHADGAGIAFVAIHPVVVCRRLPSLIKEEGEKIIRAQKNHIQFICVLSWLGL